MPQQKPHSLPRSWGSRFDPLPSSPPASPNHHQQPSPQSATAVSASAVEFQPVETRKDDRQTHDASIFVGSLPPNVEQQELTTLLTQHLSEHNEVQGVKVIRDSRGGVCAFVQCENPAAAQRLLKVLQSIPTRPFLGRNLRYEPARAFRTLLISYRAPVQTIRTYNEDVGESIPKQVSLDLPTSMRLCKAENARYVLSRPEHPYND
jgi:sulfopyruvate decarboxylase TPP-binding subunit